MKILIPTLALCCLILSSCMSEDRGTLEFVDKSRIQNSDNVKPVPVISEGELQVLQDDLWREKLLNEKSEDWAKIVEQARITYAPIAKMVKKKCLDCHDSLTPLPFYGRIFPSRNPVTKHQVDGLKSLDFANVFPLKAKGSPPQLALLKAIRSSVTERTMPLKSYLIAYPLRRIRKKDQKSFLAWIDPLIEEIESFDEKYAVLTRGLSKEQKVTRLFQSKCLRCHGNGNNRGSFGGMDNYDELFKDKKAINLESPEKSPIYTLSVSGRMPVDKAQRLTQEELDLLLEWIEERVEALR